MNNLKKIRVDKKITQVTVANFLKIPITTYASYEQGKSEPNIKTLISLADFYNTSIDYLCAHPNKNNVPLDGLTEIQKNIVHSIRGLNEEQSLLVLGYIGRLKEESIDDVLRKIH